MIFQKLFTKISLHSIPVRYFLNHLTFITNFKLLDENSFILWDSFSYHINLQLKSL